MALSYLRANRYLSREQIPSNNSKGRKFVFSYTYHDQKLAKISPEVVSE